MTAFKWHVFISHASEDKESVARPLSEKLKAAGLEVWLDENELTIGDRLRSKIDHGLAESRYGIIILSLAFFGKEWPENELNGLFALESERGKVILPVWHGVDKTTVAKYSALPADRFGISTSSGLNKVCEAILLAIHSGNDASTVTVASAPPAQTVTSTRFLSVRSLSWIVPICIIVAMAGWWAIRNERGKQFAIHERETPGVAEVKSNKVGISFDDANISFYCRERLRNNSFMGIEEAAEFKFIINPMRSQLSKVKIHVIPHVPLSLDHMWPSWNEFAIRPAQPGTASADHDTHSNWDMTYDIGDMGEARSFQVFYYRRNFASYNPANPAANYPCSLRKTAPELTVSFDTLTIKGLTRDLVSRINCPPFSIARDEIQQNRSDATDASNKFRAEAPMLSEGEIDVDHLLKVCRSQ